MTKYIRSSLILLLFSSCSILKSDIPQPQREFRGVWVATVVNIDWPKSGKDKSDQQKADYLKILDFYKDLNFNAIIFQVRTAGDAFYPSKLSPWSRFLSGKEGEKPNWEEDPLQWIIDETHKRGMEFHAWFNPYRATFDLNTEILSPDHDYFKHPEWMVKYGKKYYYDPGLPQVRQKFSNIVAEVVSKYDIDGVHLDDYFYPYKIKNEVFSDSISYYNCALENQSLADWRRSNIDSLVKNVNTTIKEMKPWLPFGISPFGVWKNNTTDPKGSDTKAGQTTYEDLYADPLLWMEKRWVDYMAPQVYWSMDLPVASHRKIMAWWSKNASETNLYIGNGAYKVRNNSDEAWNEKKELPEQIKLARKTPEVTGNILFSAKSLMNNNPDVVKYLKRNYYKFPALPPKKTFLRNTSPEPIQLVYLEKNKSRIKAIINKDALVNSVLIYRSKKKMEAYSAKKIRKQVWIDPKDNSFIIPRELIDCKRFAVTFLDPYGRESKPIVLHLNQIPDK
ncbi:glycoside hydrolase family 10 protein [Maribacter sp. 2210JD10-5]|uniref:glycoside hydrolase family 10 protein n=1 Tax=Maribacter sp. 2210JD10-5 TaxID=3386272 RepID=UPI0039BD32E5